MITIYALSAFKPELKGLVRDIRPVWTLEELGLPYERIVMDPMKGEHKTEAYKKLNPFGKVPTMVDGDFVLFESTAICSYLGDKICKLIPTPLTKERAIYDQWVSFSISTFEPQVFRVFGFDFFSEMDAAKKIQREEALGTVSGYMGVVDQLLAKQPYLLGPAFSIADILFSSACRAVGHTDVTDKHPFLKEYLRKNAARRGALVALEKNG